MKKTLLVLGMLLTLLMPAAKAAFTANGWYWNPSESGTGFMFEAQGNAGFVAFFLYDDSGKPVWYVSSGQITDNGNNAYRFNGTLQYYRNGQPAGSTVYKTPTASTVGNVRIDFAASGLATLYLPSRTQQVTRFDFAGIGVAASRTQPETGWYWNPAEGGRGYAIEVQNNRVFLAMFHYNSDGSPTWNILQGPLSGSMLTNEFEAYIGGQTLSGAFKAATKRAGNDVFSMRFSEACAGTLQFNATVPVAVRRFSFGQLPGGQECRAGSVAISSKIPGTYRGNYSGNDTGNYSVYIDAGGRVFGTVQSTRYGLTFTASGQVAADGTVSVSTLGTAGGSVFSGTINTSKSCAISGNWQFLNTSQGGGTFSGNKDGGC
ncbi:hypothetical protein IGB42_03987 [Andreprevotia sp. IGB-42]|uniref:hypothetical protein n=1 Tax=Andreprevotia sp. IGB-42 TaxID=2497473 RepID=UPI0013575E3E|nr:hypothetical protein [Andreprevotia sp. IGB-42]KAF0811530.1 hypothetical protein IGB42_03987 [Andreprevotia sp. IGB-42]